MNYYPPTKPSDNESLHYRKKHYSFSKSSKDKRNISPNLNNQNYSFSHQPTNNDNQTHKHRSNNEAPTNTRFENPMVFELLLKQKRKIQDELDEEKMHNKKLALEVSELKLQNQSLEKITTNNMSFENEQTKKYRNLKEKFHSLIEKKNDFEAEITDYSNKINEQTATISHLQAEKQDLRQKYISKNKDYEKLYREFSKYKEENELNLIKTNAEFEKLVINFKELEKKYHREREINKNLENYNSKLLEENDLVIQEKMSAKSSIPDLEKKLKDQFQKIEYLEKELGSRDLKLAKRKNKIQKLKEIATDYQRQMEKNKMDLIEIEEKNINLAEFIRKEVQNKSLLFDPSPTFKDNTLNFTNEDSKTLNKSYENLRFADIPVKESPNPFNNVNDYAHSPNMESKFKYKKYGRDAQAQFNLEFVKEKLGQIQSKKQFLEKRLKTVEREMDKF